MQRIELPAAAGWILSDLEKAGYEAYIVGGCVRDSLMGNTPKDWDITTSAKPQDVKKIFRNTYDTGIEHGTVSVRFGTEIYEVTTYRVDGNYSDHRRPDAVEFTASLAEDLKRRDFTMNAMAYHPRTGLVDLYGGCRDIEQKRIRAVGDPMERFDEDALRMLRAYRFAARFGFTLDPRTEFAIRRKAPLLANVSRERVQAEMDELLTAPYPGVLRDMAASGLMHEIIPEWDACVGFPQNTPYHCYTVDEHLLHTVEAAPRDRIVRWAALLHDIGKPYTRQTDADGKDHFHGHAERSAEMADQILRRLKFDNNLRHAVVTLVTEHDRAYPQNDAGMRHLLNRLPDGLYPYLHSLQEADAQGRDPRYLRVSLDELEEIQERYDRIVREKQCVKLSQLAVTGRDLMGIGFSSGREMGQILNLLLEQVLDHPEYNQREVLLSVAGKLREKTGESNG